MRVPDLLVPATEPPTVDVPAARRRRRVVTAATTVLGTALLAATLRVPRGSAWFSVLGLLVAATGGAFGSFVSGPSPRSGYATLRCAVLADHSLGRQRCSALRVLYVIGWLGASTMLLVWFTGK